MNRERVPSAKGKRRGPRMFRIYAIISIFLVSLFFLGTCGIALAGNPDGTIDQQLRAFYPANSSFYQASLTASDIDGDGQQEILVGNMNGQLYCFTSWAKLKWNYNVGAAIQGAPACYDVDGDGKKEVWVGDLNGVMWGFSCKGQVLSQWGWPRQTRQVAQFRGIFSSPAVGDINGDGAADIVVGTYGQDICAWTYWGAVLPGWPYDNKDSVWSSPALADIDRDGLKEVIIGADSTGGNGWPYPAGGLLYAFNGDGSIVPGFPRWTPEVTWSSPAVADINGDGWYEIVIGTGHYYKAIGRLTTEGHRVYAYYHDGTPVAGWPVAAAGSTFSSPAIGDIDGDGKPEIAIACNPMNGIGDDHIMVYRANGQFLWDIKGYGGPMMGSPALGDITGDGRPDVITGSGWQICAYDYTGRTLWSEDLDNYIVTSPVVGDFDGDGHTEVAVATGDRPGGNYPGGMFYVFDLGSKKRGLSGGDRTLYPWNMFSLNSSRTIKIGNEPPPPPPPPPPANFHEYILLMNPNGGTAHVTVEFMNEKGNRASTKVAVKPRSRATVFVNKFMPGCGLSAKVSSDIPVISERAMYFNFQGKWQGGTDSVGAQAPSRTWFLAEGYTADNFEEYVLVQNPSEKTVHVKMTFMREGNTPVSRDFTLAPVSRFTLNLKGVPGLEHTSVSTRVEADGGVICERSMYFSYNGNVGGHDSIGVTEPSSHWYLPEGYTAQDYDTYVLVQNPANKPANVIVSFLRNDGFQKKLSYTLPPSSRKTVHVDEVPGFESAEVSTEVRADRGVIAERAMYFNAGGRDGGHDSIGVSQPAKKWYLAEGYTGDTFDDYALIMNPGTSPVTVKTTLMRADGYNWSRTDTLLPRSRFTIHVDEMPGFNNAEVSTLVEAQGAGDVIAERAMYFLYNGVWGDGHDSIGVNGPANMWYFAEGYTGM